MTYQLMTLDGSALGAFPSPAAALAHARDLALRPYRFFVAPVPDIDQDGQDAGDR